MCLEQQLCEGEGDCRKELFNILSKPVAKLLFQQIWSNTRNMLSPQAEPGSTRGQRGLWVIMYVGTWVINLVCVCV